MFIYCNITVIPRMTRASTLLDHHLLLAQIYMSSVDPHESDALSQVDDSDLQPVGYGHHVSTPVRSVHVISTNVHVCTYNYSVQRQNL